MNAIESIEIRERLDKLVKLMYDAGFESARYICSSSVEKAESEKMIKLAFDELKELKEYICSIEK